MQQKNKQAVESHFTYHPPTEEKVKKCKSIRLAAMDFMVLINELCPESREKSLVMTKIEEAVMWANAAISRNE